MTTTALSCGNRDHHMPPIRHGVQWIELPSAPSRTDIDPLLDGTHDRLVVHGTDADLAAVVLRLLRKQRLDLPVGFVPSAPSTASALWGIEAGDIDLAFDGKAHPVPLIRDDAGGVLLGAARVRPIMGQAYCDDQRVLDGAALEFEVTPDPAARPLARPTADPLSVDLAPAEDGLRVTVVRRGLFRRRRETTGGRAVQASFRSATVVRDDVPFPRPAEKWGWYRHTEDLLLAR